MEMEKDQAFVEMVIKALVEHPDDVKVDRKVDEMGVLLTLTVNPEDMGKIIGKEGRTAKAVRTLLRVLGARQNARVNLKIEEPEGGSYVPPADDSNGDDGDGSAAPAAQPVVDESPVHEVNSNPGLSIADQATTLATEGWNTPSEAPKDDSEESPTSIL